MPKKNHKKFDIKRETAPWSGAISWWQRRQLALLVQAAQAACPRWRRHAPEHQIDAWQSTRCMHGTSNMRSYNHTKWHIWHSFPRHRVKETSTRWMAAATREIHVQNMNTRVPLCKLIVTKHQGPTIFLIIWYSSIMAARGGKHTLLQRDLAVMIFVF